MTKYLIEDAESASKGFIYAPKGTKVDAINISDTVAIVVDDTGNRFPVRTELLSDTCPELKEKIEEQETVIAKEVKEKLKPQNQIINSNNQSTLF